jgi:hypothetical protein
MHPLTKKKEKQMHKQQITATPKPSKTASGRELHACIDTKQSRSSALTSTTTHN